MESGGHSNSFGGARPVNAPPLGAGPAADAEITASFRQGSVVKKTCISTIHSFTLRLAEHAGLRDSYLNRLLWLNI